MVSVMVCCLYFLGFSFFLLHSGILRSGNTFFSVISFLLVVGFYQAVLDKCAWKAERCKEFAIFALCDLEPTHVRSMWKGRY